MALRDKRFELVLRHSSVQADGRISYNSAMEFHFSSMAAMYNFGNNLTKMLKEYLDSEVVVDDQLK